MPTNKIEMKVRSMPETTIFVGSEGDISIRDNGKTIRVLTAEQARELAHAFERAVLHTEGKLIGDGV